MCDNIYVASRFLLLCIYIIVYNIVKQKSGNAVLGLPYALASLSFCKAFNLDLLEACAALTIVELWLMLGPGHAKRASSLVHRSLPMILGHGGLELRARANIALAKCYLSDPTFSSISLPRHFHFISVFFYLFCFSYMVASI